MKKLISRKFLKGGILKAQNAIPGGMPTEVYPLAKPDEVEPESILHQIAPEFTDYMSETYNKYVPGWAQTTLEFLKPDANSVIPGAGGAIAPLSKVGTTLADGTEVFAHPQFAKMFHKNVKAVGEAGNKFQSLAMAVNDMAEKVKTGAMKSERFNSILTELQPYADRILKSGNSLNRELQEYFSKVKFRGRGGGKPITVKGPNIISNSEGTLMKGKDGLFYEMTSDGTVKRYLGNVVKGNNGKFYKPKGRKYLGSGPTVTKSKGQAHMRNGANSMISDLNTTIIDF